jgi:hypothetical protein
MFSSAIIYQWGKSFVLVTKLTTNINNINIPYSSIICPNSGKGERNEFCDVEEGLNGNPKRFQR